MRIVVTGGGTGGHIYPALALIHHLKNEDQSHEFLYIGSKNGLEQTIVKREGISFHDIEISGFKRKITLDNIKTIKLFLSALNDCKKVLKEFKPDIVIGTGGYVCGPVVYAASKLKIPTVIHEQNSIPGLTNKFLSRYVNKIAVCFEESKKYFPSKKVVFTGNPRASQVLGYDPTKGIVNLGLHPMKKTVLVVGGSRGAKPINDAFIDALPIISKKNDQFIYITGDVHYEKVVDEIKKVGNPNNVLVKPFIHNMPEILSGIDLIIARAGATTLAEITALGIPSILVPSPYVTNNHQFHNAEVLRKRGASILVSESELNGSTLMNSMDNVLSEDERLQEMKKASYDLGVRDASERLVKVMKDLIK